MSKPTSCSSDDNNLKVMVRPGSDLNEPVNTRLVSNPFEEDSVSLHTAIDSDSTSERTADENEIAPRQSKWIVAIQEILHFIRPLARCNKNATRGKTAMPQSLPISVVLIYLLLLSLSLFMAIAFLRTTLFDNVVIRSLTSLASHEESIVPSAEEEDAHRKLRPHAALTLDTATRSAERAADEDLPFQELLKLKRVPLRPDQLQKIFEMDRGIERMRKTLQGSRIIVDSILPIVFFLFIVMSSAAIFFSAPHVFA